MTQKKRRRIKKVWGVFDRAGTFLHTSLFNRPLTGLERRVGFTIKPVTVSWSTPPKRKRKAK